MITSNSQMIKVHRNRNYGLPPAVQLIPGDNNASVSARLVSELTVYLCVFHCNNTLGLLKFPSKILVDLHQLFRKVEVAVVLQWLLWDDLHFKYHRRSPLIQKLKFTPDEINLQTHIHVNSAQIPSFICSTWSLKGSDPHPGHC